MELHVAWNQYWYVFIAGGALLAAHLAFAVVCWLQSRRMKQIDGRIAHLSAAVALLTDTMEGGLHDLAREVTRASAGPVMVAAPRNRTATQRRVRSASKRGRTVRDIAATEQMSEGEVRLMLQMSAREGKENAAHAEMR